MEILYLEDTQTARDIVIETNRDRDNYNFNFCDSIIDFDYFLFEEIGYIFYKAIVMDLCINMPLISKGKIAKQITELDHDSIPTKCASQIPLYGLDYFIKVMYTRPETKKMIDEGRVIFFSGHAQKIKSEGLYSVEMPEFKNVPLFDRSEDNATYDLFQLLKKIREMS